MSESKDVRELVGDDVPAAELEKLGGVHTLLQSVPPPPPEVPASLTRVVLEQNVVRLPRRRRVLAAVAAAAVLAAASFAGGMRFGGDDFDVRFTAPLEATENAAGAEGVLRVGERMENGNWGMEVEVDGLRALPKGGYYVLWLAKDGEYAATCGTFTVGRDGSASVYMNASYNLREYDAWVVTAHLPNQPEDAEIPWLLQADIEL
jgi:hypothetical protein